MLSHKSWKKIERFQESKGATALSSCILVVIFDFGWLVAEAEFVFEGIAITCYELLVLSALEWRTQGAAGHSLIRRYFNFFTN
ncbi:unnamed protein product [Urochloa humidicola]